MGATAVYIGMVYIRRHTVPLAGSLTHTVGFPPVIGMPSTPGNVPKEEPKERFSCITMITCFILWTPFGRI